PLATTYCWLQVQKKQLRRTVKETLLSGIDKEELVLLKFTDTKLQTEVRWERADEFEYQGQMYDVVHKEVRGDTALFWCWPDHRESVLNRALNELVFRHLEQDPLKQTQRKKLKEFFQTLYCTIVTPLPALKWGRTHSCGVYAAIFTDRARAPPVPPPEFVGRITALA
ncbi:MAG: hypothetical protein KDC44_24405, partial [Phaeodactylibacter sp.]|nr:hypothetical protein [Phaeodactylibacter sp.]